MDLANKKEGFRKHKIRCPEGAARRLLARFGRADRSGRTSRQIRNLALWRNAKRPAAKKFLKVIVMTAIVQTLVRSFHLAREIDILRQLAMFSAAGLLVSLLAMTYGLDLSPGFF
jgi:hypothetical protein